MLAVLGRYWSLYRRSCAALGRYVGGSGPLLGPPWAVLGSSWGLCESPGPPLGFMLAVLGTPWSLCEWSLGGLGPRSDPKPSASKVLGGRDCRARRAGPDRSEAKSFFPTVSVVVVRFSSVTSFLLPPSSPPSFLLRLLCFLSSASPVHSSVHMQYS